MIDLMHGTDTDVSSSTKQKSKTGVVVFVVLVLAAAAGAGIYWKRSHNSVTAAGATPDQSVAAVKDAEAKWSKAAQSHDMATFYSFYADDAAVLPANAELLTNKPSVQKYWTDTLTKNVDVSWTPMYVEASAAGDLV